MPINPALIKAGASLLGGIFGSKNTTKESWKGSYGSIIGHAQGLIEAERRTGINPLTLLGASPGSGIAGNNAMGQAFSDAAMFAADAFLKDGNQQALLVNQYQEQNRQLQERLTHVTLQPKVPGVYGGGDGPGPESVGAVPGGGVGPAGSPRDLADQLGSDYGREVDELPVPDVPAEAIISFPDGTKGTSLMWPDGERVTWHELPEYGATYAGSALADQAKRAGVNNKNPLNLLWAPFWPETGVLNPFNYDYSAVPKPKFRKEKPRKSGWEMGFP